MKKIVLASVFIILIALIGIGAHAAATNSNYMPIVMVAPPTPTFTPSPTPTQTPTATPIPVLLPNGSFESGHAIWHEVSSKGFDIIQYKDDLSVKPYDGSWAAWEGGSNDLTESIDQTVQITALRPYLSYRRWIKSNSSCGNDTGKVTINGVSIDQFSLCTNTNGWAKVVYNLTTYVGQSVILKIALTNDGNEPSSLFLDYFLFQSGQTLSEPVVGFDLSPDVIPLKLDGSNR